MDLKDLDLYIMDITPMSMFATIDMKFIIYKDFIKVLYENKVYMTISVRDNEAHGECIMYKDKFVSSYRMYKYNKLVLLKCYINNILTEKVKYRDNHVIKTVYSYGIKERKCYLLNGNYHRIDGPAIIDYNNDGVIIRKQYKVHGERYRERKPCILTYYDNGNKCSIEYASGESDDISFMKWHINKNIACIRYVNPGDEQPCTICYNDKNQITFISYKNGQLTTRGDNVLSIEYHKNRRISSCIYGTGGKYSQLLYYDTGFIKCKYYANVTNDGISVKHYYKNKQIREKSIKRACGKTVIRWDDAGNIIRIFHDKYIPYCTSVFLRVSDTLYKSKDTTLLHIDDALDYYNHF